MDISRDFEGDDLQAFISRDQLAASGKRRLYMTACMSTTQGSLVSRYMLTIWGKWEKGKKWQRKLHSTITLGVEVAWYGTVPALRIREVRDGPGGVARWRWVFANAATATGTLNCIRQTVQ